MTNFGCGLGAERRGEPCFERARRTLRDRANEAHQASTDGRGIASWRSVAAGDRQPASSSAATAHAAASSRRRRHRANDQRGLGKAGSSRAREPPNAPLADSEVPFLDGAMRLLHEHLIHRQALPPLIHRATLLLHQRSRRLGGAQGRSCAPRCWSQGSSGRKGP